MISKDHSSLSVEKQCKHLKFLRSGVYYKSKIGSALSLKLMQMIDSHYMNHCFKGTKRMYTWLTLDKGKTVNLKRIERLYYKVMRLRVVIPRKHNSRRNKAHKVYPYLLKILSVGFANQAW